MMDQHAPWDEIARLWCDRSTPMAEILARYGVTRGDLLKAARAGGWPKRRASGRPSRATREDDKPKASRPRRAGAGPARAKPAAARPVEKPTRRPAAHQISARAANPRALVKRIYNTIDKELNKLEEHDGASSQDRERASRALSQMVSSLEKAVEMQREFTREQGRKETTGRDKEALKHAEQLRREIADRLERLHRQRATAK